jgi:hypothetical protein
VNDVDDTTFWEDALPYVLGIISLLIFLVFIAGAYACLRSRQKSQSKDETIAYVPEVFQGAGVTSYLTASALPGTRTLMVANEVGFQLGRAIIIGYGTPVQEGSDIVGLGPITLATPLRHFHAAGATITMLGVAVSAASPVRVKSPIVASPQQSLALALPQPVTNIISPRILASHYNANAERLAVLHAKIGGLEEQRHALDNEIERMSQEHIQVASQVTANAMSHWNEANKEYERRLCRLSSELDSKASTWTNLVRDPYIIAPQRAIDNRAFSSTRFGESNLTSDDIHISIDPQQLGASGLRRMELPVNRRLELTGGSPARAYVQSSPQLHVQ